MAKFDDIAPWAMRMLIQDFGFSVADAAAIMGNAGHESGGLVKMQEIKPVVAGSRGGYGWFQWTGPRRRAFEAYCKRNGYDPASNNANYKFLFIELKSTEKKAVNATKKAVGLYNKVKAFELNFERAGVKHYDSRLKWAQRALAAYEAGAGKISIPPAPTVVPEAEIRKVENQGVNDMTRSIITVIIFIAVVAAFFYFTGLYQKLPFIN